MNSEIDLCLDLLNRFKYDDADDKLKEIYALYFDLAYKLCNQKQVNNYFELASALRRLYESRGWLYMAL